MSSSHDLSPPDPTAPAKPVRLRDIAEIAGVHITAVSAVLSARANTKVRVSAETAERIRTLAAQLNYRPHLPAQIMMRKRKTGLIGLLEFGRSEASSRRTDALAKVLRERGYHVLAVNVLWYRNAEEAIDYVLNAQVEGVILVMLSGIVSPPLLYQIQNAGVACVSFNGIHLPGIPQVRSDIKKGIEELTDHLLKLGHRNLSLLTSWDSSYRSADTHWPTKERVAGFKAAIRRAGGTFSMSAPTSQQASKRTIVGRLVSENPQEHLYRGSRYQEAGYQAAKRLLDSGDRPDALLCANDRYAFGVLRACFETQLKVPEQIAVVGFNGEMDTKFFCPALTTVDILQESDAEAVMDFLQELISQHRPLNENLILKRPCQLIVRESCGANIKNKSRP